MTLERLQPIIKQQRCEFYQPKVNRNRVCNFPKISRPYFEAIKNNIEIVFDTNPTEAQKMTKTGQTLKLYQFISTSPHKSTRLIKIYLQFFSKKFNLTLTSHSFRIGYMTKILEHSSVDPAQSFVGHKDIRSAMVYSRYDVADKKALQVLDKCFK